MSLAGSDVGSRLIPKEKMPFLTAGAVGGPDGDDDEPRWPSSWRGGTHAKRIEVQLPKVQVGLQPRQRRQPRLADVVQYVQHHLRPALQQVAEEQEAQGLVDQHEGGPAGGMVPQVDAA